jgi:iron complex transport system ATP-binding protein
MEVVRLRGVEVRLGGARLLGGIDWTVHAGEHWAVLGSNGAGKTTLLQVLAGALAPTAGEVALLGEPVDDADLDELLPRIGWASFALDGPLAGAARVREAVVSASYGAVARAGDPVHPLDERRAEALLARLGCRALGDRRYASLSEGERKRVQIARALMSDPEMVLLDEPAAGLDLGGREAMLRWLARLTADPSAPATVLVTHHVEEIPAGLTHVLLLRGGTVLAAGPIGDTLTGPNLSRCFGLPLAVERRGDRYAARLGGPR